MEFCACAGWIRIAFVVLLCAGGCGPNNGRNNANQALGHATHPPKRPPASPRKQDVPLDPELAAAARKELLAALHSNDALDRAHALEAIRLSGNESPYHARILTALGDPEAIVRFAAALSVGELKIVDAKPLLLKIAYDKSPSVRVGVRFALHRLGDTRLSHDLEQLSRDPLPWARANTALVLGLLREPSATNILVLMRVDHEAVVRQQASEALWRLGDKQGFEDLVGLSVSGHPDDRMIGILALAEPRDQRVLQHVVSNLWSDDAESGYWEVYLVAARAAGMLGSDEGYGVALQGAKRKDPRQRQLAALAFGAIGRSDAQPVLKPLLTDADPSVRIAAAGAILQLKS